ncbi:HAD family phosphatase [Candidatus Uhrbacteria bacterium]|nr:HAD family phosphatase [Candidatus Uhrbacteria bacterium]
MKVRLGVFDMDGTCYRDSLTIDLFDRLRAKGVLKDERFRDVDRLKRLWKDRQTSDAYETYVRALVEIIENGAFSAPVSIVSSVCNELVEEKGRQVYEFTRELVTTLRDLGYTLAAISGSPRPAVEAFVRPFDFKIIRATEYEVVDGFYTGRIAARPVDDKATALQEIIDSCGAKAEDVIAVGDTGSDYGMLRAVGYPIAFNPSLALKRCIRSEGVPVWGRPIGIVTQRKDDVTIASFQPDQAYRPRLVECRLSHILPKDAAEKLGARLGSMYQYP